MQIIDINEIIKKGIKQLPNGKFKLDKIVNGVRITMTRDTIEELVKDFIVKANLINKNNDIEMPTFAEVFNLVSIRNNHTNYTIHKNELRFLNYFSDIKDMKVNDITNTILTIQTKKIHDLVDNGTINKHYANSILRILKNILEFAYDEGYIGKNINHNAITLYKIKAERSEKIEENYMTEEELIEFSEACLKIEEPLFQKINNKEFVYIMTLLFYTGARINEARAIKCEDITLYYDRQNKVEYAVIYIKGQLVDGKSKFSATQKNGSMIARKVFIPFKVYEFLRKCIRNFNLKESDFALDLEHTGNPKTRSRISDYLDKYLNYCLENKLIRQSFPKKITPHGFRYSHTFYLQTIGVSPQEAAKMQGHTVQVMTNYYTRSAKDEITKIFGKQ